jgi:hypothetical protein
MKELVLKLRLKNVAFVIPLVMSAPLLAQNRISDSFVIPYSPEYVARTVRENTDSSADFGKEIIPEGIFLEVMFRKALSDADFFASATATDYQLLTEAPSRVDESLANPDISELADICKDYYRGGEVGELAKRFDDSRRSSERRQSTIYRGIFERLSPLAQVYINKGRVRLEEESMLSYSMLNMSGLAADAPELASEMLASHCKALADAQTRFTPGKKSLQEDVPMRQPITGNF